MINKSLKVAFVQMDPAQGRKGHLRAELSCFFQCAKRLV